MYDKPIPKNPNSLFWPLGRIGYISWQADNSAAVLALVMFFLLLLVMIFVAIISACAGSPPWGIKAMEIIGQALLAIVGAVLGAGARSSAPKDKD